MYKLLRENAVQRIEDGACIPFDQGNREYRDYLEWVAEGNTPNPADPPPPPDTRRAEAHAALQDVIDEVGGGAKMKAMARALKAIL